MKMRNVVLAAFASTALFITGCNKQSSSVDTTPIENSFQSADASVKPTADKVVSEIKAANYSGALADLQQLGKEAKLTPEQQQAIKDVMAQVQKAITESAGKAADDANKAATDLQKKISQ